MPPSLEDIPWARRLKYRHLEVFLAVHDSGSLTAAAAQLHMTQPALSHWLADIEGVIGRPLFTRGRKLDPTEDGEVLYRHAARMLGDVQRTHDDLEAVRAGRQGRLKIGTGLPRVLLPRAIGLLQLQRPGVHVSVIEAPQPDLLDRLAHRDIDIVIGALTAPALESSFATKSLIEDRVQVVARRGHPLTQQREPALATAADATWLLPPTGSVMRQALDDAFAAHGLQPPVPAVEANSSIRVQLLLDDRPCLSILTATELALYQPLAPIEPVRLMPDIPFPNIGAIWEPAREGPVLLAFLEALRQSTLASTVADRMR